MVEWAHLIEDQLPDEYLQISIYNEDMTTRRFVFEPVGKRYERLCEELFL